MHFKLKFAPFSLSNASLVFRLLIHLASEGGQALSSLTEQVVLRLQQLVRRNTKKGFFRPWVCALAHGLVENLKELTQRDLVHAVDQTHLTDEEVENAASRCNYAHARTVHIYFTNSWTCLWLVFLAFVFTRESSYWFQRVLAIAILSVCTSVSPSVRHTGGSVKNGER